ncbi:senescence-associated carboxylesterase [Quillaja saponaria]|uniref:Senescence-associated carboxylesterase n=1 Tax=Quillaja saponaria TaxID=32244 RepID=A0AAD7PXB7_QUISA|nr:senescence-associated carboxylesterase [Quillaja saponaria]
MEVSCYCLLFRFSSGSELATLVLTSGVLDRSLTAISDLYRSTNSNHEQKSLPFSIKYEVFKQSDLTIIAFVTAPTCTQNHLQEGEAADLVPSSYFKEQFFEFLCTKVNPSFSVNKAAIDLFISHQNELSPLKNEISSSISTATRLIITGHSLGGSIASLFTLLLLDSIDLSKYKRPLCITFGSPLIGDKSLQQAILEYSTWNSCFLHVASHLDPLPRLFISRKSSPAAGLASQTSKYQPFGTFLLCSEQGFSCFENPESILGFLVGMSPVGNPNKEMESVEYGNIVKRLSRKAICEDVIAWSQDETDAFQASIILQLIAIGLLQLQQLQQQKDLIKKINKQEKKFIIQKRKVFDPSKKLNDMKIYMAYLEWYKKESKAQEVGYYDSYKTEKFASDLDVVLFKKILTNYWKDMVKEVESKPQREGAAFRTRWLYGGTNYRRMVEPLDIAEYYKGNGTNYQNQGRSQHHKQLEKWLDENNAEKAKQAKQKTVNWC